MDGDIRTDLGAIRLPRWGRVSMGQGVVPWLVLDDAGEPVAPIRRYLIDLVARDNRAGSVRSYALDLLRWWRWLLCTCQAPSVRFSLWRESRVCAPHSGGSWPGAWVRSFGSRGNTWSNAFDTSRCLR